MNPIFDFNLVKAISKSTSIHKFNLFETFHIYNNFDNTVNCESDTNKLSEFLKYYTKKNLRISYYFESASHPFPYLDGIFNPMFSYLSINL